MLDALLDRKGVLSRQIGEAKREGKPIDDFLVEMKQVSAEINKLKADKPKKKKPQHNNSEQEQTRIPVIFEGKEPSYYSGEHGTSLELRILESQSHASDWDQYVQSQEGSSIYHLWAFREVIVQAFGHKPIYLAAFDQQGGVCGVLPAIEMKSALFGHFIVALPYFSYGAALADNASIERSLYEELFRYAKDNDVGHVELRCQSTRSSILDGVPCKEGKVSMLRALPPSTEQLWSDIGTKVRAQIKKAERFDLTIRFGKEELIDDYYAVFAENMRDLGTPVYGKSFFQELMSSPLKQSFDIGVVYHEARPVACCFLMSYKGMMEIPWASALNFVNHMNVNMFMYWQILKRAVESGNEFFVFGRSTKDAPTYRFKKQWGAKPMQLSWYYWLPEGQTLPELNPNNPKYKLLIAVWQRMPVWLTKIVGPPVVKYLP